MNILILLPDLRIIVNIYVSEPVSPPPLTAVCPQGSVQVDRLSMYTCILMYVCMLSIYVCVEVLNYVSMLMSVYVLMMCVPMWVRYFVNISSCNIETN